jgi:hypothetical protein
MSNRNKIGILVIALSALLLLAGSHPLVDHWGQSASSGAGTFGSKWIHTDTSGTRYGLWGQSNSSDGRGVYGYAASSTGDFALGVYGETNSSTGRGVHGYASSGSGVNYGVTGSTYSTTSLASGVYGFNNRTTGTTKGVMGVVRAKNGIGVIGALDPSGNGNGAGVYGENAALSGTGVGVEGYNSASSGWAGYFTSLAHGVTINAAAGKTGLVVTGGSKSASVPTSDGDRLLYNEESTEVLFTDYGFGTLQNGVSLVAIDPVFAETVNLNEPYHVFLQPYGDADIYVDNRTTEYFEVRAGQHSTEFDIDFSYRIVAKRLGFEDQRLEFAPWVTEEARHLIPRERIEIPTASPESGSE